MTQPTSCPACLVAQGNPLSGEFIKSCPDCQARSMAHSPFAFAARQAGKANKGLESGLQSTWTNVSAGIKRVNHWMDVIKKYKEAACRK